MFQSQQQKRKKKKNLTEKNSPKRIGLDTIIWYVAKQKPEWIPLNVSKAKWHSHSNGWHFFKSNLNVNYPDHEKFVEVIDFYLVIETPKKHDDDTDAIFQTGRAKHRRMT